VYIYKVAKSLGFSFGQKKRKSETQRFSLARDRKSVGFPPRTNHSRDVVSNLPSLLFFSSSIKRLKNGLLKDSTLLGRILPK